MCAEVEELRSQVNRLQSRNRELELQSSGRNSDHARQIRQVKTQDTHLLNLQASRNAVRWTFHILWGVIYLKTKNRTTTRYK